MAEFRTESNQFHVGIYWHTAQAPIPKGVIIAVLDWKQLWAWRKANQEARWK
jgi:hypothetical protein